MQYGSLGRSEDPGTLGVSAALGCARDEEAMTTGSDLLAGELDGGFEGGADHILNESDWLEGRVVIVLLGGRLVALAAGRSLQWMKRRRVRNAIV